MEVRVEIPKLNRVARLEVESSHSLDSIREVICKDLYLGGKEGYGLVWRGVEIDDYSKTIGQLGVGEGDRLILIEKPAVSKPVIAIRPGKVKGIPRRRYLKYLAAGITAITAAAGTYMYQATKYAPTPKPTVLPTPTPTQAPSSAHTPGKGPVTLVIAGPEWLPSFLTGKIAEGFTEWSKEHLGYPVTVKMDLTPWGTYHDRLATVFAAKGGDFDLLIADTQFIGEFAAGGHILKLNDWIRAHQGKNIDMFDFPPNLVKYCSTYPVGDFDGKRFAAGDLQLDTVNYWGLPHSADTMLLVWRADLFRHPKERAAFLYKYGYELPQTYDDWMNWVSWLCFRDFAEFFTRKAGEKLAGEVLEEDFYGAATWNSIYDSCVYQFHSYLWEMGGDVWDEKTHRVQGYINSELAVEALEWYASLRPFEPPGSEVYWFDETLTAMAEGRVAMIVNAESLLPPLFDPSKSRVHDKVEVAPWPGMVRDRGPYADGEYYRVTPLIGQSICVNAYSKYRDEALAFLTYWFEDEQQWKWSDGGGGVAALHILNTDRFINAAPWNRAHRDTVGPQRDSWNVPVYLELMLIEGGIINGVYAGKTRDLKGALDELARVLEETLMEAGLL